MRPGLKTFSVLITAIGIAAWAVWFFAYREYPITIVLPNSATPVNDNLKAAFDESSELVFRTFNGEWVGTDCDVDILLHPDGNAHLTVYGNAVHESDGTYAFSSANRVTFDFPTAYTRLPDMDAYNDGSGYILVPAKNTEGFIRGDEYRDGRDQWDGLSWTFKTIVDKNR